MSIKRKVLGYACIGRLARVSDWIMSEEQVRKLDQIQRELFELMDEIFPKWNTINVEVVDVEPKEEEPDV